MLDFTLLPSSEDTNAYRGIGVGAKPRKVQELQPGYFKDWVAGTELGRDGFKTLMQIELRR
jgi:hypothetical protein